MKTYCCQVGSLAYILAEIRSPESHRNNENILLSSRLPCIRFGRNSKPRKPKNLKKNPETHPPKMRLPCIRFGPYILAEIRSSESQQNNENTLCQVGSLAYVLAEIRSPENRKIQKKIPKRIRRKCASQSGSLAYVAAQVWGPKSPGRPHTPLYVDTLA